MLDNLLTQQNFDVVLATQAAGTADTLSSSIVDCANFDGVMFVCLLGDVTATAVVTLTAQQDNLNAAGGMATLSTDAVTYTAGATDADSDMLLCDIHKPTKRYLSHQLTRATANAAVGGIIAIRYNAANKPTTQGSTVLDSAVAVSPAEA